MPVRAWTRLGAAAVLALACHGPGGDAGSGESATTTTTGGEDYPLPRILEPASAVVNISADRQEPLIFAVDGVVPGVTEVVLNGRSLGGLVSDNPIGTLSADALTLFAHGAMLQGAQMLRLVNPGEDRSSREVTIQIQPSATANWSAVISDPVIAEGTALVTAGADDDALLAVIRAAPGGPPEAQIFRASAGAWVGPPKGISLVDHVVDPAAWVPGVALALEPASADAEARLRIAWRVGVPGSAVVGGVGPWSAAESIVASELLRAPGPITEPLEWSAVDHLRFVDGALFIELIARVDAEVPRPGDRRLVGARWPAGAAAPTAIDELTSAARIDFDSLGPALLAGGGDERRCSLRSGAIHPALVEFTAAGAPMLDVGAPSALLATTPGAMISLATVRGSLGARTIFAVDPLRGPSLTLVDERSVLAATLSPTVLLEDPPVGDASPAVLDGVPLVLIPFGDAAPLRVFSSDGALLRDRALADVYCDRVAAVPVTAGVASLGFACARGGEVRLGVLTRM